MSEMRQVLSTKLSNVAQLFRHSNHCVDFESS